MQTEHLKLRCEARGGGSNDYSSARMFDVSIIINLKIKKTTFVTLMGIQNLNLIFISVLLTMFKVIKIIKRFL